MPEYQSLYRKYRSQTFADLVGQDAASRALQGAIVSGRVAHAYLFSGSRGTGKTSAARLLAKALNCTGRPRDSAEPCNKCQSCVEMTAGSALDLIMHLERMQDGSRRVTSIVEVGRMESDVITLSELFKLCIDEVLPDGTVVGGLRSTGLRPTFLDKFERHGITLPSSLFATARATAPHFLRSAEA